MTWEYLDKLAYRWHQWLPYVSLDNKKVVELNCGKTGVDMLCHLFGAESYIANDIIEYELDFGEYYQETDDVFKLRITECDVLLLFGIGGQEITGANQESKTITQTTIDILNEKRPQYAVIEGVTKFEPLLKHIIEESGYSVLQRIYSETGDDWVLKRVMYVLEAKE